MKASGSFSSRIYINGLQKEETFQRFEKVSCHGDFPTCVCTGSCIRNNKSLNMTQHCLLLFMTQARYRAGLERISVVCQCKTNLLQHFIKQIKLGLKRVILKYKIKLFPCCSEIHLIAILGNKTFGGKDIDGDGYISPQNIVSIHVL